MPERRVQCSVCGGSGKYAYNDVSPCYGCNGHGYIIEQYDDYSSLSSSSYTPSTPSRSPGPDAEARMLKEADGYFWAKNYDKAISLYDKIIDSNSRFKYAAYFMRGKCYLIKGDSIRFKFDLERAADLAPKNVQEIIVEELAKAGIQYTPNSGGSSSSDPLQEGDKFFNEGNYDKAITKYSRVIMKGEGKSLALMKRAACYVKKGDKDQAIDDYTAAISSGVLTGSDLATAKAELAKLKQMRESGSAAPTPQPAAPAPQPQSSSPSSSANAAELVDQGNAAYEAGDYAKAVELYTKAANMGNTGAYRNLGNCYATGTGVPKDGAKAVEWFEKAANMGDDTAMRSLGIFYCTGRGVEQDFAQAEQWFNKSLAAGNKEAEGDLAKLKEIRG